LLHNTTKESYNLLENLLEWGRSQRQATIKPIQIEIQGIVSETVQLLSSMASAKNIKIETEINNECKAFVDPMMFKTIIRNLVSNAIKFTPNSGKITLNCNCNNQLCTIQVSDTGVGIPIDRIELIFDDSKVFSTSGTNSEKGTGLGLKLVKRFVDKNGGSIRVNSNEGQGTTFTITLPAQESN
ncbi:MAG: HAMP domain-containing histidine kinase, partial [Bacteroidales bacterium]